MSKTEIYENKNNSFIYTNMSVYKLLEKKLLPEIMPLIQDYLFDSELHKSNVKSLIIDLKEFQGITNLGEYLKLDSLSDTIKWKKRQDRYKEVEVIFNYSYYDDYMTDNFIQNFVQQLNDIFSNIDEDDFDYESLFLEIEGDNQYFENNDFIVSYDMVSIYPNIIL